MVYFPFIGFTLSQRESYAPAGVKLPPPHDIATQTPPLHIGVAESVQSADAEHPLPGAPLTGGKPSLQNTSCRTREERSRLCQSNSHDHFDQKLRHEAKAGPWEVQQVREEVQQVPEEDKRATHQQVREEVQQVPEEDKRATHQNR